MNKEEAIEVLNNFKSIEVLYGNTFAMHLQQLEQLQNAIKTVLQALDNSIPKERIEEVIEKIQGYTDIANECIENNIVIADSDSLNFGRKQAHGKDIEELRELLEGK